MRYFQFCCILFITPTMYSSIDIGPVSKKEAHKQIVLARETAERTRDDFMSWTVGQTTLLLQQAPVAQRPGK